MRTDADGVFDSQFYNLVGLASLSTTGFDETFDFYLDETDVCLRLVDAGFELRQIDAAIRRVMHSGHYILGPETEAFEREFAAWLRPRTRPGPRGEAHESLTPYRKPRGARRARV